MRSLLGCSLFVTLLVVSMSGCVVLSGGVDFPLQTSRSAMILPPHSEITATLTLSQGSMTEQYLLALRSGSESFKAALLTVQGMPLSTVDYSAKTHHIATQLRHSNGLHAALLLDYLELIYRPDADLGALLKKNWRAVNLPGQRQFLRGGDNDTMTEAFSIRYGGEEPWYRVIELYDARREQRLVMRILGQINVLPQ